MKIAVIGANGKAGKLIVKEAIERNHDVTAVVRSENKSEASKVINKDLFELTKADLTDFDVVVSAFGTFNPDTLSLFKNSRALLRNFRWKKHSLTNSWWCWKFIFR